MKQKVCCGCRHEKIDVEHFPCNRCQWPEGAEIPAHFDPYPKDKAAPTT